MEVEKTQQSQLVVKESLPNATATLVLGILSIVLCGTGIVLGIIALVISSNGKKEYKENPDKYTESSFKNLNAGRICAIIGLCISGLYLLFFILYFVFAFSLFSSLPFEEMMESSGQY